MSDSDFSKEAPSSVSLEELMRQLHERTTMFKNQAEHFVPEVRFGGERDPGGMGQHDVSFLLAACLENGTNKPGCAQLAVGAKFLLGFVRAILRHQRQVLKDSTPSERSQHIDRVLEETRGARPLDEIERNQLTEKVEETYDRMESQLLAISSILDALIEHLLSVAVTSKMIRDGMTSVASFDPSDDLPIRREHLISDTILASLGLTPEARDMFMEQFGLVRPKR